MVEHQPFGKEIKKLFRPHGVGEKTYAAIVVLQVVLFAVAISLIVGYWMWKERQPAPSAPPVVVNMPVTPGYQPPIVYNPDQPPFGFYFQTPTTRAPENITGSVYSKDVKDILVSINNNTPLQATFLSEWNDANKSRDWQVSNTAIQFEPGDNVVNIVSVNFDGKRFEQTQVVRLVVLTDKKETFSLTIRWLPQPVEVDPLTVMASDRRELAIQRVEYGVDSGGQAFRTGTVQGGIYDGDAVYIFESGTCQYEMGCPYYWYRALKDPETGRLSLLTKYSDPITPQDVLLFDEQLSNATIPDLTLPGTFALQSVFFQEKKIGPWGTLDHWFGDYDLVPVGSHAQYGAVYTTKGEDSTNAFYLRTPDNRIRGYAFDVPFLEDQKIPQIAWDDRSETNVDYLPYDFGGCGSSNAYAVRSKIELKPNERLVRAGTSDTKDPIYLFKTPADQELIDEYERWYPYNPDWTKAEKPSFESFVALKPIFYWKDPFNRWIRFKRADLQPMAECGKPVIYLYPEKEMPVHVMVGLKGEMTVSEPEHGKKGWDVLAKTDGYVVNQADGKTYPNLFWEGTGVGYQTPKQGFVVAQKEVAGWLEKTLAEIGFTERESAEFREFWVPRLPQSPYLFITFVPQSDFDRDAPLYISPKPDTVSRVFMEYHPLYTPEKVTSLPLPKIERNGFAVVEWGGALR